MTEAIKLVETVCSNFAHEHNFVVQAWDGSLERWLDTRFGSHSLTLCIATAVPDALQPWRWMQNKPGRIRIVRRLKPRRP